MSYIGATMTLPGIAGFILTMGMGVDSNVLIFERIKEELAAQRGVRASISDGFSRVFLTLLDTHSTSLISAAFLFQFGTGPIRGFATTLVFGLDLEPLHLDVRVDERCSSWCCRVGRPRHAEHLTRVPSSCRSSRTPNYDFVGYRWHAIALSMVVILAGLVTVWP